MLGCGSHFFLVAWHDVREKQSIIRCFATKHFFILLFLSAAFCRRDALLLCTLHSVLVVFQTFVVETQVTTWHNILRR